MKNVLPKDEPVELLLVEDNEGDIRLTVEAFKESRVANNLSIVKDGCEALAFLRREGRYGQAIRPDIILLDLNLPKVNGQEVLAQIKRDEELRHIPVLILTTSLAESDIQETYDLHANCYVAKPVDLDEFATLVRYIEYFWLSLVQLPKT